MAQDFIAKGFSMEVNTSLNEEFNNPHHETFSRLDAEFLGALEEPAINFSDAEDSIKTMNDHRISDGKQG